MPIFWSHGTEDRNIPNELKEDSLRILKELNNAKVEEHMYGKMHHMCVDEVNDLKKWMETMIPQSHQTI